MMLVLLMKMRESQEKGKLGFLEKKKKRKKRRSVWNNKESGSFLLYTKG